MGSRRRPRGASSGDRYRQLHRRGPPATRNRAPATGTPRSSATTRSSRSAPIPARSCTSANRKREANTQRGIARFVDELLARVRRAGHTGQVIIRAESGFENHKQIKVLDARGIAFSIGVKISPTITNLIAQIPEADWVTITDYPETGEAQIAETVLKGFRLIVRRTRLTAARPPPHVGRERSNHPRATCRCDSATARLRPLRPDRQRMQRAPGAAWQ